MASPPLNGFNVVLVEVLREDWGYTRKPHKVYIYWYKLKFGTHLGIVPIQWNLVILFISKDLIFRLCCLYKIFNIGSKIEDIFDFRYFKSIYPHQL